MASHGQVVQRSAATTSQAQTVVTTETQTPAPPVPILRLRGAHASRRRVQWTEDVVDNEGLGRKSSKGNRTCSGRTKPLNPARV